MPSEEDQALAIAALIKIDTLLHQLPVAPCAWQHLAHE